METKPSMYIAGIVIFCLVIASGVYLIGVFNSNDDIVDNGLISDFNSTFDKSRSVSSSVDSLKDNIENAKPDSGLFGVLNSLINTAWSGLSTIFTSFSFMAGFMMLSERCLVMRKVIRTITFYDDGTYEDTSVKTSPLTQPGYPWEPVNSCSKCGLKLEKVMGYVCNQPACPTGLGGSWCSTNE